MAEKETEAKKPTSEKSGSQDLIAVVRVRGNIRIAPDIRSTLEKLNVLRANYATLVKNTPSVVGMLKKAKDYVTWGPASAETIKTLQSKAEPHPRDPKKKKSFMKLHPPRGGYGRKGIKKAFHQSGALGDRGEKINDLIKKMI